MQLLQTVALVLCLTTVLSFKHDIRQTAETTTNEIDNSVINREPANNFNQDESNAYGLKTYGEAGGYVRTDQMQNNDVVPSTIAPQPEDVQPMPVTGCFGHHPEENANNNNNIENVAQPSRSLSGPMPQQFNPQNQGFGPQYRPFYPSHHRYFPHHQHTHYPHYPHNPWSPWRRNMPFVEPQFYPQNSWSPWRRQMPFVMPPSVPQFLPQNGLNRHPLVIVKLLQPIILPVAKRFYPEGGDRDPDSEDVDTPRYMNGGFQKYLNGRSHRMGFRRFSGERMRSYADKTHGQKTYGPYKINGENVDISIKLH